MKKEPLKSYTFDEVKDKFLGIKGTSKRDAYEQQLGMDLLGTMIKKTRKERGLSQEELGKLIGVQKSWVSRLENSTTNVSIDTLIKVFSALKATINFTVNLDEDLVKLA